MAEDDEQGSVRPMIQARTGAAPGRPAPGRGRPAGVGLLVLGQAAEEDREEDQVVDPQHDLQRGQRHQAGPTWESVRKSSMSVSASSWRHGAAASLGPSPQSVVQAIRSGPARRPRATCATDPRPLVASARQRASGKAAAARSASTVPGGTARTGGRRARAASPSCRASAPAAATLAARSSRIRRGSARSRARLLLA